MASDLIGFASALLLLIPSLYTSAARNLVRARRAAIVDRAKSEGRLPSPYVLSKLQAAEDAAASLYRAEDRWMLVSGLWMLLGSFALKLIYHFLDKWV